MEENKKSFLVVGGGIAGITCALEAAEAGCRVILIEKSPYLGGRVARMHQYFPKLCPPIFNIFPSSALRFADSKSITNASKTIRESLSLQWPNCRVSPERLGIMKP